MFMKHNLLLFLCFSFIIFSAATSATRSISSKKENPSVKELLTHQGTMNNMRYGDGEDGFDLAEGSVGIRRIDLQNAQDYSGAGANPEHDPKPPGKV
ncbi:hypothetical protein FNV43_RR15353 [Rhamnella rubrinervis]|uniref:Uncharacterized protein n=1 Tax=Rhamnella rubrinervis TaxID=2594499 RepID=A0A8K0E8R2_9ROSA|nr:hypothetical protein FNV43_RR15353 [Rhamnella rubrinervis]